MTKRTIDAGPLHLEFLYPRVARRENAESEAIQLEYETDHRRVNKPSVVVLCGKPVRTEKELSKLTDEQFAQGLHYIVMGTGRLYRIDADRLLLSAARRIERLNLRLEELAELRERLDKISALAKLDHGTGGGGQGGEGGEGST